MASFKCDECGREFSTEVALSQHTKDKHGLEGNPVVQKGSTESKSSKQKGKSLRKKNRHPVAIGIAAVALVVALGLYVVVAPSFAAPAIPCSTGETYIHVHPYLQVIVEGTHVTVPAYIGYLPGGSTTPTCLEEMHTHDASGIIHIELSQTDKNANYTLADFFKVWKATYPSVIINGTSHPVTLSETDVFGFQADATHQLVFKVDNQTVSNGPGILLEQLDYCGPSTGTVPPCYPTAGSGYPYWKGSNAASAYPYGTNHTIIIDYVTT